MGAIKFVFVWTPVLVAMGFATLYFVIANLDIIVGVADTMGRSL